MDRERRELEEFRRTSEADSIENTLIDELITGEVDRAGFIRRSAMFGLSASVVGAALRTFGGGAPAFAASEPAKVGGRIRVGIIPGPTKDLEPHTLADLGGFEAAGIAGEFLTRNRPDLTLAPELAVSWSPNATATVWRFKLRPNVKFQSGQKFGADDVVATYKRLTSEGSGALSAFKGVLSPDGIRKVDDLTVEFHLDAPNANFVYLTSSTTYQAIILPADYKIGTFTKTPQTTAAFKLVSYQPGVGAKYDRFTGWWGGRAPLDGVDATFYSDDAAVVSAMLGGQIDLIGQINVTTGRALFNNKSVKIFPAHGATHRQIPLGTDQGPLKDYRVRQALALTLDRPAIVKTLFNGFADLGNDSPFAPVYPSTAKTVPQRHRDLRKAKQLLAAAGHHKRFKVPLTTEKVGEIPQLAQIFQRSARKIGVDIPITVLTSSAYFSGSQTGPPRGYGTTPWLNAPITITDWGHRSVPNVILNAAFRSGGVWNAAHYRSKKYNRAFNSYVGAISLTDQRKYAAQIEKILLHDTPVIIPYFYNYIQAASTRVKNYNPDAIGQIYLSKTSLG
ncbi:MAG: ABC transporter substrate-binding protein [Actinomycetota bacterium]